MRPRHLKIALLASALIATAMPAFCAPVAAASAPSGALAASAAARPATKKKPKPAKPAKLIDINSASREQLKTLPGLSDEQIDKLIAARPFLTKADLVTSNVVPTGVYIAIKHKIIAKQALPLKLKK